MGHFSITWSFAYLLKLFFFSLRLPRHNRLLGLLYHKSCFVQLSFISWSSLLLWWSHTVIWIRMPALSKSEFPPELQVHTSNYPLDVFSWIIKKHLQLDRFTVELLSLGLLPSLFCCPNVLFLFTLVNVPITHQRDNKRYSPSNLFSSLTLIPQTRPFSVTFKTVHNEKIWPNLPDLSPRSLQQSCNWSWDFLS